MRAPTKATGGGGFTFADKVAAGFLVQMLARAFPIGPALGPIAEIHFEASDTGQVLDDLLLVLKRENETTRCAISIKSNRQLSNRGFHAQFVEDAWEQWHRAKGQNFNPETGLLGLVTGVVDNQTLHEWRSLQEQDGAGTPQRMLERLADSRQSSAVQRAILESLRRPRNGVIPDALETARLVSRIRVLPFLEGAEGDYVNRCAQIVFDGSLAQATKLWSRLLQMASESRATGGYFNVTKLVGALRPDFELRDYPDFEADWKGIDAITAENIRGIHSVLGRDIKLARAREKETITTSLAAHNVVILAGESGSGKSVVISELVADDKAYRRIVWLRPEQLSKTSHTELARAFGLRHSIPELIRNSSVRRAVLVVDGFERLEGDARKRALELIGAVRDEGFIGWKLIITCQPQSWESTQDALVEAGVSDVHKLDFEKPQLQEVYDAVRHLPEIRVLLARSQLQPILRNLVILDWVLRAELAQRFPSRIWIGETELIQCVWQHWIGDGVTRVARDSLLRTIGMREGERLSGATHVDSIETEQQTLLGTLSQEGLIRVELPSVTFAHDLMGDWARFHILSYAPNDAVRKIKEVAPIPRWGHAIRLYSQSLVEQGEGLANWKTVTAQLAGEDAESRLASDLFLDGLLFAANAEALLEQVWPDLLANEGVMLRRLIKRLELVASVPDIRLRGLVDPKVAEQAEIWFRIPHPLYWYPALCVFSRHAVDVSKHALLQAAELCALWLRKIPDVIASRREAGLLALELAREAQGRIAEGMHFSEKDQVVYEALLLAASEFPIEVAQISLELSARREEPQHAIARGVEAEERQAKLREYRRKYPARERIRRIPPPTTLSPSRGPLRARDVDGPLREVSDGFRSAVLDTAGLSALISARPEIAREVLLAVCIDEPQPIEFYRDRFLTLDRYGLADWKRGYPAIYWKGPFLKFLQDAPDQGLAAIMRLVNYATHRWLEDGPGQNLTVEQRQKYGLEFELYGKTKCWIGDGNVFGWHRSSSLHGATVECGLMALEKWLYDEVESGRDISRWVQNILSHAESLAFAGVLVAVGLKYPALFTRDLQPFLGNIDLYECQLSWALGERNEVWRISLAGQGQPSIERAAEWHRMAHRRSALQDIAPWLMHQDVGTRKYLAWRKVAWSKRLEAPAENRDVLELLMARLDSENYTQTPQPDGKVLIEMRVPTHLQAKVERTREESEFKMLALTLASRARQYLSEEDTLPAHEVPAFAAQIERLVNWQAAPEDSAQTQYRMNSIAGGIAVLIIQHRAWLAQHPELESWCFDILQKLQPGEESEFDSPESVLDSTAESFLGEAGAALLLERSEEWVLRMVLEGVTGFYYRSVLQTMWRAYRLRGELGEKFYELVNVVVLWSALRRAATRESGYQANRNLLAKYKATLFRRYATGRLKGDLIPLRKAELLGRHLVERISRRTMSPGEKRRKEAQRNSTRERRRDRKLYRDLPDLDVEVLRKGFAFLPEMVRAPVVDEGRRLQQYIRELFDLEMRTLPLPESGEDDCEIEGAAYEFDSWVMARVAEFIVHANSVEVARTFYRPILALGPAGRYWVEDFLQAWVRGGLETSADLATFSKIWDDMVHYAMTLPAWQPSEGNSWCRAESLVVYLMGLRETQASVLGQAKYRAVVSAMAPTFERWAGEWLKFGSVAAWFAHFLPTESGRVLLAQGTKQLAVVVPSIKERDWHEHGLGVLFTETISACWKHLRNEIESQSDLRKAFLSILTELCARHIPEALHLRNKVSQTLGTP